MNHNSVSLSGRADTAPCDKPAVGVCADCGTTIWSDCRRECCGASFCVQCYDSHVAHVCLRKPVQSDHWNQKRNEAA
jgi:hypothetical protein